MMRCPNCDATMSVVTVYNSFEFSCEDCGQYYPKGSD
jgi:transcription initiation factor TFIIIB Brf1 subunit/transcription initiation factor TFIIB